MPLKSYMLRLYVFWKKFSDIQISCITNPSSYRKYIMVAKFRIFRRPIIAHSEKVTKIKAACVLHHYLWISDIRNSALSSRQYCPPGCVDHENSLGNYIPGDWRSETGQNATLSTVSHVGSNTFSHSTASIRNTIKQYVTSSSGEIESQYCCHGCYVNTQNIVSFWSPRLEKLLYSSKRWLMWRRRVCGCGGNGDAHSTTCCILIFVQKHFLWASIWLSDAALLCLNRVSSLPWRFSSDSYMLLSWRRISNSMASDTACFLL